MLRRLFTSIGLSALLTCLATTSAWALRLEAGTGTTLDTTTTPSYTKIAFQQNFDVVPIVVALTSSDGTDPADLRIRNITTSGFEIAAREPSGEDGTHSPMNFHYVAMEPGQITLPGGTSVAAGFHTTASQQRGGGVGVPASWDTINFGTTLSSTASVIAAIQTENSEVNGAANQVSVPFFSTALRNASASTVQVALERSEVAPGNANVVAETIGWIAFPSGTQGSLTDYLGNKIGWDARTTANTIRGWDNGCFTSTFSSSAWPSAVVVASKAARNGGDGGWLRRCSLSGTTIGLNIDEDRFRDTERRHTTETASLLSFSDSFHTAFLPVLKASKVASMNPGVYALPGNVVRYAIETENSGNTSVDTNTMIITDIIPDDVALVVADISGSGSGPVIFSDGSPTSTLTYTFSGLSSTVDDVSFSSDNGSTFNYVPSPGTNGEDPNVTHIRINPKGGFIGQTTSSAPNFTVEFDVVIN